MVMRKDGFVDRIRETITRFRLVGKGDRVLVALSGGPDSVALLYGLLALRPEYKLKLCAAHLNHKLRGAESDQDEKFAKELASRLGLKFFSKSVDVRKEAKKRKLSIEEAAREVRYGYLEQLADRIGADKIAVGHQADDQAETFLMRLLRGAGAAGLSGIQAKRGRIIRPLIQIKRVEIEKFLKTHRIAYRLDSSNYLTDYYRNKVRLLLLPKIKEEFNPRIVDSLNRAADIISLQHEYVEKKSEQILGQIGKTRKGKTVIGLKKFAGYDPCLQREMIRLCVRDLGGDIKRLSFELVDRALDLIRQKRSGRRIGLDKDIWFETGSNQVVFFREEKKTQKHLVKLPGRLHLKEWDIRMRSEILENPSAAKAAFARDPNVALLDWAKLKPPFVLRSRRRGDRFRPFGMKGTKSVADFLIDAKVPRHLRDEVPILTSRGKIAWVVGHRISDEFKVTPKTRQILKLRVISPGP